MRAPDGGEAGDVRRVQALDAPGARCDRSASGGGASAAPEEFGAVTTRSGKEATMDPRMRAELESRTEALEKALKGGAAGFA